MSEQNEKQDAPKPEAEQHPVPMVQVQGAGYITRKDGTVVPFTIQSESK